MSFFGLPLLERYVFRRVLMLLLLVLGALVATMWMTQVLRELDVVTAKGQAIWMFILMTLLALPALIQVVAPIAFLIAATVTLNGLNADSELPVMAASGASSRVVARPILLLGIFVFALTMAFHHYIAPGALSGLRTLINHVRADLIATLVKDGGFRTVDRGLTMHIREKAPDGSFRNIFVSDDRNAEESTQYIAKSGVLLERGGNAFLIMKDGELVRENKLKGEASVVEFETYGFDLSQFKAGEVNPTYKPRELTTPALIDPDPDNVYYTKYRSRWQAELHDRFTAPLYTISFGMIALLFCGRARTNRQDRGFAMVMAIASGFILRGAGFAVLAAATSNESLIPLLYVVPIGGAILAWLGLRSDVRWRVPQWLAIWLDRIGGLYTRALSVIPGAARWQRQAP
ncbi:LPS export ABC transporter permease LptF [Afifella sp. IM 167]|uniref:LPS export ABC transporter permease LptF n=1 Tax=Afifella sp. IM 167 TaxID=2033586 RepID=UPI001CCFFD9C|nr:LPS export ABC transporter permease LptF [Afifella sp. IM 167]MBZ8131722.1 LPS export ABC transporter permease LptF [Afifella sp. IM 167]